jgi:NAD(P)-dependent dehydrogenase (short-subunit alcohol dehydrogenase family)
MSHTPSVLITGASSGFGLLTAQTLLNRGYTVFATMREPAGRNARMARQLEEHAAGAPGALQILELDVTSDASVTSAVERALDAVDRLDVVVNNAGIGAGGLAESFTPDQHRRIFDINVFGVQRVNRAVLPSMRRARSGLLIHVSSIMGRLVIPFAAPYTASKFALEGLVESYRYELTGTGVDVVIIEPGGFPTSFGQRLMIPADEGVVASYGKRAELAQSMWGGFMERLQKSDIDPQLVADAIQQSIETPAGQRPLRVVVDPLSGGEGPRLINQTTDQIQAQLLAGLGLGEAEDRNEPLLQRARNERS